MQSLLEKSSYPLPGSDDERKKFKNLQGNLKEIYQRLSSNRNEPHTTVIVPSLSLDEKELSKVGGTMFYEERLLCLLMLLRRPRTRIIFVSSAKINDSIIQYYLSYLHGIPLQHAVRRLTMLDTGDMSSKPLTQKILESPWLLDRIRKNIFDIDKAHLVVFNTTPLERSLSVQLGIPVYGLDPDLIHLGNKSGCRRLFKEADIPLPHGFEDLKNEDDIVNSLDQLWADRPEILRAVIKLNEGFAGRGNALFDYRKIMDFRTASPATRKNAIRENLPHIAFEAEDERWPSYLAQFQKFAGVVEEFIEGKVKHSPSVQARVNGAGTPQVISTHDQELGGPTGQQFVGCLFPAKPGYRKMIQEDGQRVAEILAGKGVLGRFAVDFIVIPTPTGYERYAIEINLRRGGTTHPFLMMKFLVEGGFDLESGDYLSESKQPKYYFATDYIIDEKLKGMRPEDLMDVAAFHQLHYDVHIQRGVVFHMIGAIGQFGKLGITCIGDSYEDAVAFYNKTREVLRLETTAVGRAERLKHYLRGPKVFYD